jgi:tetratricopeptide (TPR) repeat protein
VLPALRDHALEEIRDNFAALLPQFADDYESGRNRSLLASLDYTLRRLTDAQRALLVRLAPFESGAEERNLLTITEIPEGDWNPLRSALEQAALLTVEHVHANIDALFLRFHPVLAPYLRSRPGSDDAALQARYVQRYQGLARYLYHEDARNPQPVRALVWRELPNMRRALALLAAQGDGETLADMANSIAMFLGLFGLLRERGEIQALVARVTVSGNSVLTQTEYLHEINEGEADYARGDIQSAYARFSTLLGRMEAQPAGAPLGRGSYEHCQTLVWLARCLRMGGQRADAEGRLRAALAIIDALIAQQPNLQGFIRQRGLLLTELGDVLRDQGKYGAARAAYEASLDAYKQFGDPRGQGVLLGQFGTLALTQRDYGEARERYTAALDLFQALDEPAMEAVAWHQLGMVAEQQREWATAEDAYRRSAEINMRLGNLAGAAATYNQLANVAKGAGHRAEAEGWYRRSIEIAEQLKDERGIAIRLNNLANLLLGEAHAGNMERLTEAWRFAERALAIVETLDLSEQPWATLNILAAIATLEGRAAAAREYRQRERAAFAAFAGNRWQIDQQHRKLIAAIAAAAQGDAQARAVLEAALPQWEANGWQIADATRRICAGEREWSVLVEELGRQPALLVLRVLEEIESPSSPQPPSPSAGEGGAGAADSSP